MQAYSERPTNTDSITDVIDSLRGKLEPFGISFEGYNSLSLSNFRLLPTEIQKQILESLTFSLGLVSASPEHLPAKDLDIYMLEKACRSMNLKVPEDFIRKIRTGDIVEIYEIDSQTQVFRNFEFLRHCSYDLLTVCITPYPELFERQAGFLDKIVERSKQVTETAQGTESWGVENHTLVERLDSHQKRFLLKLGNIAPVFQSLTGRRVAWASTIQVEDLGSAYRNFRNVLPL